MSCGPCFWAFTNRIYGLSCPRDISWFPSHLESRFFWFHLILHSPSWCCFSFPTLSLLPQCTGIDSLHTPIQWCSFNVTDTTTSSFIYVCSRVQNSGPYTCTESTPPTETRPQFPKSIWTYNLLCAPSTEIEHVIDCMPCIESPSAPRWQMMLSRIKEMISLTSQGDVQAK